MPLNAHSRPKIIDLRDQDQDDDDDGPIRDFEIGDPVEIWVSGERGTIVGRGEWLDRDVTYTVRYDSNGVAVEKEWAGSALALINLH